MKNITIYDKVEELNSAAAELFAQQVKQAVVNRGCCHVVLAGGETPRKIYELLAEKPYCETLPWENIHIYWGDERCVPATDPLSNQLMARQAFLSKVPIPEENIHPISYNGSPEEAAKQYESYLQSAFGEKMPQFDLVLLGMGNDGHTASLFPHTDVLAVQEKGVRAVHLAAQDMYRISLTAPLLNAARNIAILVAGVNKSQVLLEVMEGPEDNKRLPVQLIKPVSGDLYWLLDAAAGAKLPGRKS